MRTTLDVNDKILEEAIKLTGIKNKTKLINLALEDEIKAAKKRKLLSLKNSGIVGDEYDIIKIRESEVNE